MSRTKPAVAPMAARVYLRVSTAAHCLHRPSARCAGAYDRWRTGRTRTARGAATNADGSQEDEAPGAGQAAGSIIVRLLAIC